MRSNRKPEEPLPRKRDTYRFRGDLPLHSWRRNGASFRIAAGSFASSSTSAAASVSAAARDLAAKSPLSPLCPMHHRVHSGSRRSAAVILVCDAGQAVAHRRPDPLVSQARSVEAAQVGQYLACPSSR